MRYQFLIDTYDTERLKTLSVWSMFDDNDLTIRPQAEDPRGRSVHEQMVHQCVSEDLGTVRVHRLHICPGTWFTDRSR